MTFADDGNTGWVVGGNGTILKTTDAGESWNPQTSGTSEQFYSATFTNDNTTGWAVGVGGTILKTTNGGDDWTQKPSGTQSLLKSVTFADDGKVGWVVVLGGTILKTTDAGESWSRQDAVFPPTLDSSSDYRIFPAPWTWMVCLLALLPLYLAWRRLKPEPKDPEEERVEDKFVSDGPITGNDPDPLKRGAIADTLSRFLRNENTEPPLTIAITGEWGEGKSSLMNLIAARLKKDDAVTVCFNAWHHQKERHLFAALLQAVRDETVRARGLAFRWRLLPSRVCRYPWTAAVILFALGFSAACADE